MIIKVADFSLSVNMGAKEYYCLIKYEDVKLPVKWMAPESLADYIFSEMSDVVSDLTEEFFQMHCHNLMILIKLGRDLLDHEEIILKSSGVSRVYKLVGPQRGSCNVHSHSINRVTQYIESLSAYICRVTQYTE